MKKEIIIRIAVKTDKCQKKAMKEAATVSGVQSVTLAGGERNLLLVIGDGVAVDTTKLTKKLKNKVGSAEIVELRTVDTFEAAAAMFPLGVIHGAAAPGTKDAARAIAAARSAAPSPYQYNYQPSPYHLHHQQHQQWQYASPYAYQQYPYHPSPMMPGAGVGGGYGMGSSYSRAVALSHPANYSPLVEKHDYHPMNRSSSAVAAAGGADKKKSEKPGSTGNGGGGNGGSATLKAVPRSRRHESDGNGCCIQ